MRVISRRTLTSYLASRERYADYKALKSATETWYRVVKAAEWPNMAAVKKSFGSADPITGDRVVFDIKGNDYRLVAAIDFEKQLLWIKFFGTHKEYDSIDARKVRYVRR